MFEVGGGLGCSFFIGAFGADCWLPFDLVWVPLVLRSIFEVVVQGICNRLIGISQSGGDFDFTHYLLLLLGEVLGECQMC